MRWRLRELQGEYMARNGAALTYTEIRKGTGLSLSTLSDIGKGKAGLASLETLNKLLVYLSGALGRRLTTNDLLYFTPEE